MSRQAMDRQQCREISDRLEFLQQEALQRKKRVDSDLNRESGALPADFSEQAVAVENDEALVAIRGELELQLSQISSALQRLAAGEYGYCERCSRDINAARLEAIPAAVLCIECANLQEQ